MNERRQGPTAEDLARMVRSQPMRRMVDRTCDDCGYGWTQPAATGNCPRCRGGNVRNDGARICGLQRA